MCSWLTFLQEVALLAAADARLSHPSQVCCEVNTIYCLVIRHLLHHKADSWGAVKVAEDWAQQVSAPACGLDPSDDPAWGVALMPIFIHLMLQQGPGSHALPTEQTESQAMPLGAQAMRLAQLAYALGADICHCACALAMQHCCPSVVKWVCEDSLDVTQLDVKPSMGWVGTALKEMVTSCMWAP